jgi:hypothetical protein
MNRAVENARTVVLSEVGSVFASAQTAITLLRYSLFFFQRSSDALERGSDAIELDRNEADALG